MAKQFNDLGLGTRAKRLVNKDGSFNVRRSGQPFSTINIFQDLVKMSWSKFLILVSVILVLINALFAIIYYLIGTENFTGIMPGTSSDNLLQCFFFSCQTFTTVGYGHIAPRGTLLSLVAAFEAMTGLMIFALITGLIYGRFAKPSAKLLYSKNILATPYQDGLSLQFRIVNKRKSIIVDIHARILVSFLDKERGRHYRPLELERSSVVLFPLNWTIVHPIIETSPLHGKTPEELAKLDVEFIIAIKGYDDTFSQEVNSIHSYRHDEIVWGAQFDMMYKSHEDGTTILQIDKLNNYQTIKN